MSLFLLFIIIGILSVIFSVIVICIEIYKYKKVAPITIPVFTDSSVGQISKIMMNFACMGCFRMHILRNDAPKFNNADYLERYKVYIQDPSVITYIKNVKGENEYE